MTAGEISENIAINITNIDQYHGPAGQKVFNSQADSILPETVRLSNFEKILQTLTRDVSRLYDGNRLADKN